MCVGTEPHPAQGFNTAALQQYAILASEALDAARSSTECTNTTVAVDINEVVNAVDNGPTTALIDAQVITGLQTR